MGQGSSRQARDLIAIARANIDLGRYEEAIADCDKAIALDASDANAYDTRGWAKFKLNRYEEAIADYDEAIAIDPKNAAIIYKDRGIAKFHLGRYEEAIADYDNALGLHAHIYRYTDNGNYRLWARNVNVYILRGDAKFALKRYNGAMKDYDKVNRHDTDIARIVGTKDFKYNADYARHRAEAYIRTAIVKMELKQYAIAELKQAILLDANNIQAHWLLGTSYQQFGAPMLMLAEKAFKRAIFLARSSDADAKLYEALKGGQLDAALECLKLLKEKSPDAIPQTLSPEGDNEPALLTTAAFGRTQLLAPLLEYCPITIEDSQGNTALHRAAEMGQCAMLEALIDKGLLTEQELREGQWPYNQDGQSPWHVAASRGQTKALIYLQDNYLAKKKGSASFQLLLSLTTPPIQAKTSIAASSETKETPASPGDTKKNIPESKQPAEAEKDASHLQGNTGLPSSAPSVSVAGVTEAFVPGRVDVDVPSDNRCWFWSVGLSWLLQAMAEAKATNQPAAKPPHTYPAAFAIAYGQLFGVTGGVTFRPAVRSSAAAKEEKWEINDPKTIDATYRMLLDYDGKKDTPNQFEGGILAQLICEVFRAKLVQFMRSEPADEKLNVCLHRARASYSQEGGWGNHLTDMLRPDAWGGTAESAAVACMLNTEVHVYHERPDRNGADEREIYRPDRPDRGPVKAIYIIHAYGSPLGEQRGHYRMAPRREHVYWSLPLPVSRATSDVLLFSGKKRTVVQCADSILHLLIKGNHVGALEDLLQKYPQLPLNIRNSDGLTPLLLAIIQGALPAIKVLAKFNINRTLRDSEGRSALHLAVIKGHIDVVKYLVETLQMPLDAQDTKGKTPTDYCGPSSAIGIYLTNYARAQKKPIVSIHAKPAVWQNLVFQGGGVKGIAYVGALERLQEEKGCLENIRRVGGASAGAITALLVGLGYSVTDIKHMMGIERPASCDLPDLNFKSFLDGDYGNLILGAKNKDLTLLVGEQQAKTLQKLRDIDGGLVGLARVFDGTIWKGASAVKQAYDKIAGVYRQLNSELGLCPGIQLRTLFENLIRRKIKEKAGYEILNATFKDLAQFADFKELYFIGVNTLTGEPETFCLENTPNMVIADAVRISMSIPGVFKPHPMVTKDERGQLVSSTTLYVDGGVLLNYPVDLFDSYQYTAAYQHNKTAHEPKHPMVNEETLGLSLVSSEQKSRYEGELKPLGETTTGDSQQQAQTLVEHINGLIKAIYEKQETDHARKGDQFRTIYIDTLDVGTVDFDKVEQRATKKQLLTEGRDGVEAFLKQARLNKGTVILPTELRELFSQHLAFSSLTLKARQFSVDATALNKNCPQLVAAFYGAWQEHATEFLHQNLGVSLWACDEKENTAFHYAATFETTEALQKLLEVALEGALTTNVSGETPLDWARQHNRQEAIVLLEKTLASLNGKHAESKTAEKPKATAASSTPQTKEENKGAPSSFAAAAGEHGMFSGAASSQPRHTEEQKKEALAKSMSLS